MPSSVVVETAMPPGRQAMEAAALSVLVRVLLRHLSLGTTLDLLDRIPTGRAPRARVTVPTEIHFTRAGACLGRQVARSQYLRRRGVPSSIIIGVRSGRDAPLDAHAWLDRLDEPGPHRPIQRIER